jgi:hypothetical protein
MVNRKGIRCGAQGCRYFSGLWRAKEKLASGFEKDGASENRGGVFLFQEHAAPLTVISHSLAQGA